MTAPERRSKSSASVNCSSGRPAGWFTTSATISLSSPGSNTTPSSAGRCRDRFVKLGGGHRGDAKRVVGNERTERGMRKRSVEEVGANAHDDVHRVLAVVVCQLGEAGEESIALVVASECPHLLELVDDDDQRARSLGRDRANHRDHAVRVRVADCGGEQREAKLRKWIVARHHRCHPHLGRAQSGTRPACTTDDLPEPDAPTTATNACC